MRRWSHSAVDLPSASATPPRTEGRKVAAGNPLDDVSHGDPLTSWGTGQHAPLPPSTHVFLPHDDPQTPQSALHVPALFFDSQPQSGRSTAAAVAHSVAPVVEGKLYIGSYRDVCDEELVDTYGVRAYLCVAAEVPSPVPPFVADEEVSRGDVEVLHLPLEDGPVTHLVDSVTKVFAFIDRNVQHGRPVALFCQQGKSRSVSFALMYLMRERRCGLDDALAELRASYPRADPNLAFLQQLLEFEAQHEAHLIRERQRKEHPLETSSDYLAGCAVFEGGSKASSTPSSAPNSVMSTHAASFLRQHNSTD